MEHLETVVVWYLVVIAVMITALTALIVVQHMARNIGRLRCVVRSGSATQEEAAFEQRARDAA